MALLTYNLLQEAELIQQKAVLENRIRKLNEEAEIARLQSDRMNRRIEFLEERAAESSSTTSRQISELTDEVRQLQADLHAEKLLSRNFAREAEDARHALDAANQAKQVNLRRGATRLHTAAACAVRAYAFTSTLILATPLSSDF